MQSRERNADWGRSSMGSSGRQSHRKEAFLGEDNPDRRARSKFVEELEKSFGQLQGEAHQAICISSAMSRDFAGLTAPCAVAIIEMRGGAVW